MVSAATFRRYGAFNAEETDGELEIYLGAAKEALSRAGVAERTQSALYDMTVYQLALHMHDNRGVTGDPAQEYPMGVQSAVHQLRNAEPEEAVSP
jgi:hypothetical protein